MFNLELRCLKLARFLVVRVFGLLEVELMELAEKVLIVATNGALLIDEFEERGLCQGLRLKEFEAARAFLQLDIGDSFGPQFKPILVHLQLDHM